MGRVVAGFSVPHTPYLPMTIPQGGIDANNGPLYERIRRELEDARVDAIVIFDDDHLNTFFLDAWPTFAIGVADRFHGPIDQYFEERTVPVARDLAHAIHVHGVQSGFDLVRSEKFGVDHSIMVPLHFLVPDNDVPVIPIWVNALYPPFPSAARTHALGRMVGDAVAAYPDDLRVAVVASGSITHEVGGPRIYEGEFWAAPDPGWLKTVAERLRSGDVARLVEEATDVRLERAGNVAHELLTIVAMLGAIGDRAATFLETDDRLGHAFGSWRWEDDAR